VFIDAAHGLDWIGHKVLVAHVKEGQLGVLGAVFHGTHNAVVPQMEEFAPQGMFVLLVVGLVANHPDQLRNRGDDCHRVAVGLDEDGIGVNLQQFGQGVHVLLNFEYPLLAGGFPAQVLQPHFVDFVAETEVGAEEPLIKAGDIAHHHRVGAVERGGHE